MSIVPATNTAEKNKTRYLLRVLKAGSSGNSKSFKYSNVLEDYQVKKIMPKGIKQ